MIPVHEELALTQGGLEAGAMEPAASAQEQPVAQAEEQKPGAWTACSSTNNWATYNGATYDGNEGFYDANIADFGGYLCAKYPGLTADQWTAKFGIVAADRLNCSLSADERGRGFDYRGYMARLAVQHDPMNAPVEEFVEPEIVDCAHAVPACGGYALDNGHNRGHNGK